MQRFDCARHERFDVSRILETWKFPSLLSWGFKRLERSEAVEHLERLERTDPYYDERSRAIEQLELSETVERVLFTVA
jgi:hypothetical protein